MHARIVVLDEGRVLPWVVERVCPPGTQVLAFTSFEEALQSLRQSPPDAAVVSITPAHLPWRDFQHQCALRNPRVPVLYVSCLFSNAREAGLEPVEGEAFFLQKPSSKAELECALSSLLSASKEARGQVER